MSIKASCDVCHKEFTELGKFDALNPEYQVPGRIVHLCSGCLRKMEDKMNILRKHYGQLLGQDIRQWLLDLENKSRSKIITQ